MDVVLYVIICFPSGMEMKPHGFNHVPLKEKRHCHLTSDTFTNSKGEPGLYLSTFWPKEIFLRFIVWTSVTWRQRRFDEKAAGLFVYFFKHCLRNTVQLTVLLWSPLPRGKFVIIFFSPFFTQYKSEFLNIPYLFSSQPTQNWLRRASLLLLWGTSSIFWLHFWVFPKLFSPRIALICDSDSCCSLRPFLPFYVFWS